MTRKKILFIHSAGPQGRKEGSDFLLSHLKHSLKDYWLAHPQMPDPDNPHYLSWKGCIEKELKALADDSILVGHSLGGSVLVKYLSEANSGKRFEIGRAHV